MIRGILETIIRIPLLALAVLVTGASQARIIGQDDTVPVASLATSNPIRQAGQPVGLLRSERSDGVEAICTAAIISDRYILTASHCATDMQNMTAVFGQGEPEPVKVRVQTPPVEINQELGYAVLEVDGTPSQKFGAAKLLLRIPIKGESAFILAMNSKGELTAAGNCSVQGTNDRGAVLHDCDTTLGSSGGLLFSVRDLAILGLHFGSGDSFNRAVPMYSIALASALVRDVATVSPPIIDFRTVGNKPDEIAADFKRLYLSLHNEGRLPLKPYQVSSFSTIEDVFRSNQLFHGSPFPIELDSIACDVNPDVCMRERVEATPEEQKSGDYIRDVIFDSTRSSGKSKPSSGKWSVPRFASLWLPSVLVEQQRGWVVYRKRSGQEISEIVTREFGACDKFDDQCKNLILGMNRNQEERLRPEYSGVVLLPKASFTARDIDISTASEKGAGHAIEIKPTSSEQNGQLVLQNSEAEVPTRKTSRRPAESDYRVLRLPGQVSTPSSLDAVLKSLGETASGSARIAPYNVPGPASPPRCKGNETNPCEVDPDDLSKFHKRLLDGVTFPYPSLSDFPDVVTKKGGGRVGIIDTDLDLGHCAFEELKKANRLKPIGISIPDSTAMGPGYMPCRWLKPSQQISRGNHGSHVAGLMVGKISDKWWGLNPFATLYAGQVTPTKIGQQAQVSSLDLADVLRKMLNETGLDVVNLSMFYQKESIAAAGPFGTAGRPRGDPVLEAIRTEGYDTLFVVAAGNDGEDFTAICDMRPACLDLPNLISVAALDRGEAGMYTLAGSGMESNYGRRVHVAAPGVDILGLVNGNYLGLLSGTSQAAPQVAAIASLLRAIRPRAVPGDIKERLITCSQSVPMPASDADEDVNAIFGGRVDSTCTLMPEGEGMLQLKGANEIYRVKNLVAVNRDLVFKPINDASYDLIIPPRNLRGLRADSNPDEFTIFHKRAPEDRDASLSKDGRVRVWPDTQQLEVEVWDKTVNPPAWAQRKFPVNNVARFVAPMVKR